MTQPDYLGARGSNAGDDFHELWVLRQALKLLEQQTTLSAIAVEGLTAEDEVGTSQDTWDGVDCTFYYEGGDAASAKRIVIDQVKYSGANPHQAWTVVRLTRSTNKKQDNSVIARLAKAFIGLRNLMENRESKGSLTVRLVSNQPVEQSVLDALFGGTGKGDRFVLQKASCLSGEDFDAFTENLDLSECGGKSRLALDERIHLTISHWTDDDARATVSDLLQRVRREMMPESTGHLITRQSVLLWMGFSNPKALFPCPTALKNVERPVPRAASRTILDHLMTAQQHLCLHGEAGSGKTTALQGMESLLPRGSAVVVFDCYGGGRYLEPDAFRHRPHDAFLQLCNDLARQLQIPLLVSPSRDLDYPRVFMNRLQRASEVVASRAEGSLLVIVVDAADNSVIAASKDSRSGRSFVHDFVELAHLPENVRLIVSCRTGRLESLNLPSRYKLIPMGNFERDETAQYVRKLWHDAPNTWLDDFHYLSRGNPRVQWYALDYAGNQPVHALDYLQPHGKVLDGIFLERFESAVRNEGGAHDIRQVCAGLIELPRPIPIRDLSAVTGIVEAHVRDICNDLSPGVRITEGLIGFADEDFEDFVRTQASDYLVTIRGRIADHFSGGRLSDEYAATHVASALLAAGRKQEIIDLVKAKPDLQAISDPVLRREAQLQRLRIAMKVCRETGNNVDAMLTLLIGAEALKTDAALQKMFKENPDLAASFARDTAARGFLRDSETIGSHGPFLFQLLAVDARRGDGISVREGRRQLIAWLRRRKENQEEEERMNPGSGSRAWEISDGDIVADTEATLRIAGPSAAVSNLRRWRPRELGFRVAKLLSGRLITFGEASLLKDCLSSGEVPAPWDIFLLTPLALAGEQIDLSALETSLKFLLRRGLIKPPADIEDSWGGSNPKAEYLDTILTACEIIVAHGGDRTCVVPVLELIANPEVRRRDKHLVSKVAVLDTSLRAFGLLQSLKGSNMTLETYWVNPPSPPKDLSPERIEELKRADTESKEELRRLVGPILGIYDVRAQVIAGAIALDKIRTNLKEAINHFHAEEYQFNRRYNSSAMLFQVAVAITRLMVVAGLDRAVILECVTEFLRSQGDSLGEQEARVFENLAVDHSTHTEIIKRVGRLGKSLRTLKIPADDKISALVRLSRLVLPISDSDARALFNQAVDVAGEINAEAIHEIALFSPLALRATDTMTNEVRREVACTLATVVSDTAIRLSGYDGFPWESVGSSLAALDANVALAAIARWEDCQIVSRHLILPAVLLTALGYHKLSPVLVSSLFFLLDEVPHELIDKVIEQAAASLGDDDCQAFAEEIARDEVLGSWHVPSQLVSEKLRLLRGGNPQRFWADRLEDTTEFLRNETATQSSDNGSKQERAISKKSPSEEIIESIDWTRFRFVSTEEIGTTLREVLERAKSAQTHVRLSDVLNRMGEVVAPGDRSSHLEALGRLDFLELAHFELRLAFSTRLGQWHDMPAVEQWCHQNLLRIIVQRLPVFSGWVSGGGSALTTLLERTGMPEGDLLSALIEGIERNVDEFDASNIYALVGMCMKYCDPNDARKLALEYSGRLLGRISVSDREVWYPTDIPTDSSTGVARLIFVLMSDVDLRIRWRAAHAMRRLARLSDSETVSKIVGLYSKTSELSYRNPDAPFYWLAARLWLVMALDRIAQEAPIVIATDGPSLFDIAVDKDFPHVLIRSFAKSAVRKLVKGGALHLNPNQRKKLIKANTSPTQKKKRVREYIMQSDRTDKRSEERKFHFDTTDTVPYWYGPVVSCFADLSMEDFLDNAEHWIIDHWHAKPQIWRWDQEPRANRLSNRHSLMDNSHGSRPTLERYSTYLEWHAMFCATGELMESKALGGPTEFEIDSFDNRLRDEGLTADLYWLTDYRGPKPLEKRFWFTPEAAIGKWIDNVSANDFFLELGLKSGQEAMVVQGYHHTRSGSYDSSVFIRTALVSPLTARALVRALQSVNYSQDYRVPSSGDELEIDEPPYTLIGWLNDTHHRSGIDKADPLHNDVRDIESRPSRSAVRALSLKFRHTDQAEWINPHDPGIKLAYEAWSDFPDSEDDDGHRYEEEETVRSSGWRLQVSKKALKKFLKQQDSDLVVEVEIERKRKEYAYQPRYDKEKELAATFDKIILLRKDGTIETTEGCIGTWTTSRT